MTSSSLHAALKLVRDELVAACSGAGDGETIAPVLAALDDALSGVPHPGTDPRRMSRFLSVICHDLKDPLAAIEMGMRTLEHPSVAGSAEHTSAVTKAVARSVRKMDELIRRYNDFFRIDSGQISLDLTEQDTVAIVESAAHQLGALAPERLVAVTHEIEMDDRRLVCDRPKLTRTLVELGANAVEAALHKGVVSIRASDTVDYVRFTVQDHGCGIEPERMIHIFDPMWLVAQSPRNGTGIGIAIAKGIIEAHGGALTIRSQPNHGTVCEFSVPRNSDALT